LRDKFIRAVTEALEPVQRQQAERMERIERQIAEARQEVRHDVSQQIRDELRQEVRHEGQRVLDRIGEFETHGRRDITYAADQAAIRESYEFIAEHMPDAPRFADPRATLEYALSLASVGGLALEFGVYQGTTLKIISSARNGGVYGFDSFEGLPEDWRIGFPAGTFTVEGLPDVPGAELVVGWFDDTLPGFLADHEGPVDFLHVDGDLYSSAKTVLELVGPRLHPGSVIVFDEFFNFPGWQRHEFKAWIEYVKKTGMAFSYEGYTHNNEQVIVRLGRD
jgi:predicted O-methyltransferase YrrM